MLRKRLHQICLPSNAVSVSMRCLVGVLLLHTPASVLGELIRIGDPERVFSMDDFSSIPDKNINYMDVTSDGGRVAFSTYPGGNVYVYQTDGQAGDPVQIGPTPGPTTITQTMRFSRDDTKLFYSWDGPETSGYDIWVANIDGSEASELIAGADSQTYTCPAVANGECRLLYREGWWPIDIWSADCSGGDRVRLTFEGNKSEPYASEDGTRIVYMSQDSARCHDIFLMSSDGTDQRQITSDGPTVQECYPVLAKNHLGAEVILYVRGNPLTGNAEIWVTDLYGVQHESLIIGQDRHLRIDYVPNDPISPYGAIYYKIITGSSGAFELWRVAVIGVDDDGDGVPNGMDACPNSDLGESIIIDDCDTGVRNDLFDDGCTMADRIAECAEAVTTHGELVSCVAHLTNGWKQDGLISGRQKGRIQSCVAQGNLWSQCKTDADCDDGLFCNGVEVCLDGACVVGDPCPGQSCDEAIDECID